MAVLAQLEPKAVFHYFEEICQIPHGSGNTKAIRTHRQSAIIWLHLQRNGISM